MMFIVALYLPWCRYLSAQVGVEPQLNADNLKCTSRDPELLLHAARFTTGYVRLVGQEPAPSKCVLLSTSRAVRGDMRDWVLSQEGDLGGHLDTTFRGWSATLAARVRLVLARLVLIFALPLDFHGRLRVVRSMFLPAALHGVEASLLASGSLLKLRSAVCRVVWSGRQPLANVGAVLSGFGFVFFVGFLLCGLLGLVGLIVFWIWSVRVVVVVGLFTFLFPVLLRLVSGGILIPSLGIGLVCLYSAIWLVLCNIFVLLFLMLGKTRLQLIFVAVRVFGVVPCWIFVVLCSFLTLLMSGIVIRVYYVVFWLEVLGMVFC